MTPHNKKGLPGMINFKKLIRLISIISLVFFTSTIYAANLNTPVGYWKTIDDVTGKPKSILKITETAQHTLQAQVMRIYPSPGKDQNELCEACEGANHNKRIVGMFIMWGVKQDGDNWDGGRILDPKTGNIYRCSLKLTNNGSELEAHGYIGISLIGRTQTWIRVSGSR